MLVRAGKLTEPDVKINRVGHTLLNSAVGAPEIRYFMVGDRRPNANDFSHRYAPSARMARLLLEHGA